MSSTSAISTNDHALHDVLIIGAGPAGIATARTLLAARSDLSVVLLEARDRVGGRTHTSTSMGVPVDLGASWIHHYGPNNPIVPLALDTLKQQWGEPSHAASTTTTTAHPTSSSPSSASFSSSLPMCTPGSTPRLATAVYCGLVDAVSPAGDAIELHSPHAGLGGGTGHFVLFDADGSRVSAAMYTHAVRVYNALITQADAIAQFMHLAMPNNPPASPASPHSPAHARTHPLLSAAFSAHCAALDGIDRSVLSVLQSCYREACAVDPTGQLGRVVDFLLSGSEQYEGAGLDRLSAMSWQDGSGSSGEVECDMLVQQGYGQLIKQLASPLPDVRLRHVVQQIDYTQPDCVLVNATIEPEQQVAAGKPPPLHDHQRRVHFRARRVIVTVPLGVLKSSAITFTPALPINKQLAIDRMGFGLMNKIVLQFDAPFWGADTLSLGYCDAAERGRFRWFLSLRPSLQQLHEQQHSGVHPSYRGEKSIGAEQQMNVLVCFSTAEVGKRVEMEYTDEQQIEQVMAVLHKCFVKSKHVTHTPPPPHALIIPPCLHPYDKPSAATHGHTTASSIASSSLLSPPSSSPSATSAAVLSSDTICGTHRDLLYSGDLPCLDSLPTPLATACTRWWTDQFSLGSYAHYSVGCDESTIEMLASELPGGTVGFAGEHTSTSSIGCVDSAWETGIREAKRVLEAMQHEQQQQQNGSS